MSSTIETLPTTGYNEAVRRVTMPPRIARLPISDRGFPVPWFVAWIDGKPDFRVADRPKVSIAYHRKLCWVCGEPMGSFKAMTLGPMCVVNRTISEPPSHRECAVFSAQACPFLANPRMRRREEGLPEDKIMPDGHAIYRNPGAVAVWITKGYRPFKTPDGGSLFTFDEPVEVQWFAHGRPATRDEVEVSMKIGLEALEADIVQDGPRAVTELRRAALDATRFLPVA